MRKKFASAFVTTSCLLLILIVFLAGSVNLGLKVLMVAAAIAMLSTVFLDTHKSKKSRHIKKLIEAENQKILNSNMDWLQKRWHRVQMEKASGMLRTVERWYFDNATGKQLSRIKQLGLNLSIANLTEGQASDIIGLYEPVEEKNAAILRYNKSPLDGMNQTKAREKVASLLNELVETRRGTSNIIEHLIIKKFSDDFIYFVRFFDSHVRHNEVSPEYVPKDDPHRLRYEQAVQLGLSRTGVEIPLEEKLLALNLNKLNSLIGGQKCTGKAEAIKILMDVPDIVDRFESMASNENWFHLKIVRLDIEYLERKWSELQSNDYSKLCSSSSDGVSA